MPDFLVRILISLGALVLAFAAGYGVRWAGETGRVEARLRHEQELAQEDMRHRQRAARTAATKTEEKIGDVRTEFKFIGSAIDMVISLNPVYLRDCLDDDGLRLWNGANEGRRVDVQLPDVDSEKPRDAPAADR